MMGDPQLIDFYVWMLELTATWRSNAENLWLPQDMELATSRWLKYTELTVIIMTTFRGSWFQWTILWSIIIDILILAYKP